MDKLSSDSASEIFKDFSLDATCYSIVGIATCTIAGVASTTVLPMATILIIGTVSGVAKAFFDKTLSLFLSKSVFENKIFSTCINLTYAVTLGYLLSNQIFMLLPMFFFMNNESIKTLKEFITHPSKILESLNKISTHALSILAGSIISNLLFSFSFVSSLLFGISILLTMLFVKDQSLSKEKSTQYFVELVFYFGLPLITSSEILFSKTTFLFALLLGTLLLAQDESELKITQIPYLSLITCLSCFSIYPQLSMFSTPLSILESLVQALLNFSILFLFTYLKAHPTLETTTK